jgi:hypothetical protein
LNSDAGAIYKDRIEFVHYVKKNEIGDELNYLFSCDQFNNQRKLYIKEKFRNRLNTLKFKELMTSKNKYDLEKLELCRFAIIINKGECPPSK